MSDLRRLLHDAFDGELPRPGVVDEIVQKARAGAQPRPIRRLGPASLAGALAIPLATAGFAVALGITHQHGRGTSAPATHVTATPSALPSPTAVLPANVIPWAQLPAANATQTPEPTPLPVPPGTPPCRAAQLEGVQVGPFAAAGNDDMPIVVRNRSASACSLQGWADVHVYDGHGRLLAQVVGPTGTRFGNGGTFFDSASTGAPVLLRPGTPRLAGAAAALGQGFVGQASMNLQWTDCATEQGPFEVALDLPSAGGRLAVRSMLPPTQDAACLSTPRSTPGLRRGPFNPVLVNPVDLTASIDAPVQVREGSDFTYYVTIVNSGLTAYDFDPCPDYGQGFTGVKAADVLGQLNCAPAGSLAPGAALVFEMRFTAPEAVTGTQPLEWSLLGLGSGPAATARIMVLPPGG